MILKMLKYFTLLLLLLTPIISFTQVDLTNFIEEYKDKSQKFPLEILPEGVFKDWANSFMMKRVQNFKNILGAGSGGFVFVADYNLPGSNQWIPAAIKIFNDKNNHFSSF